MSGTETYKYLFALRLKDNNTDSKFSSSVVTFFGFIKSRITKEFPTLWPKMDKVPSHHFLLQDAMIAHINAEDLCYESNKYRVFKSPRK